MSLIASYRVKGIAMETPHEVLAACRSQDRDAQRRLFEMHEQRVFRLACRMVGFDDASDVVQQTFLQVFRNLERFVEHSTFETWLHRITVNEALQWLRRRRAHPHQTLLDEPAGRDSGAAKRMELSELLERSLADLDADLRIAFLLREREGQSYVEIAATLGISAGTVASRISRAREHLRECLEKLDCEI